MTGEKCDIFEIKNLHFRCDQKHFRWVDRLDFMGWFILNCTVVKGSMAIATPKRWLRFWGHEKPIHGSGDRH